MAYHAKQRILYYKRFKVDIWGIFKNSLQWRKDRSNYFISDYSYKVSYFKNLNKIKTKQYKAQMISKDYYFSKKEEKKDLKWRGIIVTDKMKTWLPKYWISTDLVSNIRLDLILYSNLLFKVFKTKKKKKNMSSFFFFFLLK